MSARLAPLDHELRESAMRGKERPEDESMCPSH